MGQILSDEGNQEEKVIFSENDRKRNRISVPFLVLGYGWSFFDIIENHSLRSSAKSHCRIG